MYAFFFCKFWRWLLKGITTLFFLFFFLFMASYALFFMAFSLSSCFNLLFVCLVQVFYCSRLCGCRILTFYKNLHSVLQSALHFLFLWITLPSFSNYLLMWFAVCLLLRELLWKKYVLRILGVLLLKSKKRTWGYQFLFPLISLLWIFW